MKAKLAVFLTAALLVSSVIGCSSGNSDSSAVNENSTDSASETVGSAEEETVPAETVTLKMSIVTSLDNSLQGRLAQNFKDKVEELTEGRYEIDIFPNEQLSGGDGATAINMAHNGEIDIDVHYTNMWATYDERLSALGLPFLFTSDDDYQKAVDNGIKDIYTKILREKCGVQALALGNCGYMVMVSGKPLTTVEDFKGFKMRTATNLQLKSMQTLGANPTTMTSSEVITALQQGSVDGAVNFLPNIYDLKWYEVSPYLNNSHYILDFLDMTINAKLFDGMNEEDQAAFLKAADYAMADAETYSKELEEKIFADINETGEVVNLTADEEAALKEAMTPLYEEYKDIYGEEIYKALGLE